MRRTSRDAAEEDKHRLQHSKTHHIAIQQGAHHNAREEAYDIARIEPKKRRIRD